MAAFGALVTGKNTAQELLKIWLDLEFVAGRSSRKVEKISELHSFNSSKLYLKVSKNSQPNTMDRIVRILRRYNGNTPVYVYFEKNRKTVMADRKLWIDINNQTCLNELKDLLGEDSVVVS